MSAQKFLQDLEKKLWTAANKLLPSLDAAVYKHVVLGLVFVKYVSDAFDIRREEKDRVLRDFKPEDISKVTDTFHAWQQGLSPLQSRGEANASEQGGGYQDEAGFCCSATLDDIKKHDFVLTPGRYVGAPDEVEDGEPFTEKMVRLTAQLQDQFVKSAELEGQIKRNLAGLGYEI